MANKELNSLTNPIVKEALSLCKKKGRDENGLFLVEGLKQFNDIGENFKIKHVFISESFDCGKIQGISPKIYKVSDKIFARLAGTQTPQGIIAVVEQPTYDIDSIIKTGQGSYIILDNVQDPGNVGSVIRSAFAFGVKCVFVGGGSADVYSGKVVRSSVGAMFNIPVVCGADTLEIIQKLKSKQIKVAALSLKAKTSCRGEKIENVAFVIGNEGAGLSETIEKNSDILLKIPMSPKAQSLNAAVAAAIVMYEHFR